MREGRTSSSAFTSFAGYRPTNSITVSPRSTASMMAGDRSKIFAMSDLLSALPTRIHTIVGPSLRVARRNEKSRSLVTRMALRLTASSQTSRSVAASSPSSARCIAWQPAWRQATANAGGSCASMRNSNAYSAAIMG